MYRLFDPDKRILAVRGVSMQCSGEWSLEETGRLYTLCFAELFKHGRVDHFKARGLKGRPLF